LVDFLPKGEIINMFRCSKKCEVYFMKSICWKRCHPSTQGERWHHHNQRKTTDYTSKHGIFIDTSSNGSITSPTVRSQGNRTEYTQKVVSTKKNIVVKCFNHTSPNKR